MDMEEYSQEDIDRKKEEVHALYRERYGRFVRAMKRLGCEHYRSPNIKTMTVNQVLEVIQKMVVEEGSSDRSYWNNITVSSHLDTFRRGRHPIYGMPVDFEDKVKAAVDRLEGGDVFHDSVTPEAVFELLGDDLKASLPLHAVWFHLGIVREIVRRDRRRGPNWGLKRCRLKKRSFYHLTPTHAPPDGSGKPPRKLLPAERFALISEVRKMYNQPEAEEEESESDDEEESEFVKELRQQKEMEEKERADLNHNPKKPVSVLRAYVDSDSKLRFVASVPSHDEEVSECVKEPREQKEMEEKERADRNHPLHNSKKPRKLFRLDLDSHPMLVARVLSVYGARS